MRGIAILLVLLFHANGGGQSGSWAVRFVSGLLRVGWCGVTLFFVLSGFLITNILWTSKGQPKWWRRFYVRRALRIFPLYYLALLAVLIALLVEHRFHEGLRPLAIYAVYLQNLLLPQGFYVQIPFMVHHFWSLAVEEQFYLVWPALLVAMPNVKSARWLCVVVFVLSLAMRCAVLTQGWGGMVNSTPVHMGELTAGGWLAMVLKERPVWIRRLRPAAMPVFAFTALLMAFCAVTAGGLEEVKPLMYTVGLATLSVAGMMMIVQALESPGFAKAMAWRPLQHLGVISYGVYVYHGFFYIQWTRMAERMLPHGSHNEQRLLISVLMVVLGCAAAEVSYRWFEKPILQLKDRLAPSAAPAKTVMNDVWAQDAPSGETPR